MKLDRWKWKTQHNNNNNVNNTAYRNFHGSLNSMFSGNIFSFKISDQFRIFSPVFIPFLKRHADWNTASLIFFFFFFFFVRFLSFKLSKKPFYNLFCFNFGKHGDTEIISNF